MGPRIREDKGGGAGITGSGEEGGMGPRIREDKKWVGELLRCGVGMRCG